MQPSGLGSWVHQESYFVLCRITGILSWRNRNSLFVSVVMMVHDSMILPSGPHPVFPKACKGHNNLVFQANEPRLFPAILFLPLIETRCRDQTAPLSEGVSEGGFCRDRFCPSIDHLVANFHILGPGGNEAPAGHNEVRGLFRQQPDHSNVPTRDDVVTGWDLWG